MSQRTEFGAWLRMRRKRLDVTQEKLAQLVGCSLTAIEKIEGGSRRPSRQIAERLAECLAIPAAERADFVLFARTGTHSAGQPTIDASMGLAGPTGDTRSRLSRSPGYLPVPLTSLIGRERDVEAACALLENPGVRLVTLCGTAGIGKTRLSVQVATELFGSPLFPDGVFFVALAHIAEPGLVATTVAQSLGIVEGADGDPATALLQRLRNMRLLLVLDNFEQVVEAAPFVAGLLGGCPGVKALVTSREVLHLSGEHTYSVPPLELPRTEDLADIGALGQRPAVAFFVERASALGGSFALTTENAAAVSALCTRLDGLPLAIELAASRTGVLAPSQILSRLEKSFTLLTDGPRDLAPRHRTLHEAIGWSYNLLSPGEQALFRRLGIFVGGCDLQAVEAVCDPAGDLPLSPLDGLQSLLRKSLLGQETMRTGELRFKMLETISEYAREQLAQHDEVEAVSRAAIAYYTGLAEKVDAELAGPQQKQWQDRLEAEQGNIRNVLGWAIDTGKTEEAVRLSGTLHRFWYMRRRFKEGYGWLVAVLGMPELSYLLSKSARPDRATQQPDPEQPVSSTPMMARMLTGMAVFAQTLGEYTQATELYTEALEISRNLGDKSAMAAALNGLADVAGDVGDYPRAEILFEQCMELGKTGADSWRVPLSLTNLAYLAEYQGHIARAERLSLEALPLWRKLGDVWGVAWTLNNLGEVAYHRGDYEEAGRLHEEALALWRDLEDRSGIAIALFGMGATALARGDKREARRLLADSLRIRWELGERNFVVYNLQWLAQAALCGDDAPHAARLLGAADALCAALGTPLVPIRKAQYDCTLADTRQRLGEGSFEMEFREGQQRPLEESVNYALEGFPHAGSEQLKLTD